MAGNGNRRSARVAKAAANRIKDETRTTPSKKKIHVPSTPPRKRSTTHSPMKTPSPRKKMKRSGLKEVVDATSPLGVVDPESKIEGEIELVDYEPADVMLVLLDPANNSDKFFVLQLIHSNDDYVVYTRWGRTGTAGQAFCQVFANQDDAIQTFEEKFKQKTGLSWEDRNEPYKGGKYRFVIQDFAQKQAGYSNAKWQYFVNDGVDGKEEGWYDYDTTASQQVEKLFHESVNNNELTRRLVDSGSWTYDVDLRKMIQTNVTHPAHTSRRIRRCLDVKDCVSTPTKMQPVGPVSSNAFHPSGPVSSMACYIPSRPSPGNVVSSSASAIPSTVSSSVMCTPQKVKSSSVPFSPSTAKRKEGTHPVDQDIALKGKHSSDYEVVQAHDGSWYDAVLSQCDITGSSNNNKYYRLQLLQDSKSFYCWQKWGRVGEQARESASKWDGPYSTVDGALKPFLKKFREKTGNSFDADPFMPKRGKYVPIEIDNDVKIKTEVEAPSAKANITYLPSKLDIKTKDLVEVLFSKEMRDQALTSFNLDLSRLPLGCPSEHQIQHGIEILKEIENKVSGEDVRESFDQLSSRFYTAIPHSFGRSRPPTIMTMEACQSRYDMCNILLDMFTTNETVRKIDSETKKTCVEQVPPMVDLHYNSLCADLSLLDKTSTEYKMIEKCFDETKNPHSKSHLLDVWSVDREGEGTRFAKFSTMGNRKLLWHGTNIAVVAPILTSGLRIMPHSGGRVGAGIYLASMQEKSAQYTSGYGAKFACMFLTEVPLGKSFEIVADGHHASSLKQAPDGFDSVHAVGTKTPKTWKNMMIDGKEVAVPQSSCESSGIQSTFGHDELLVYDESQVRLRYVVSVKV